MLTLRGTLEQKPGLVQALIAGDGLCPVSLQLAAEFILENASAGLLPGDADNIDLSDALQVIGTCQELLRVVCEQLPARSVNAGRPVAG